MDENVRKLSEALAATTPGIWVHADRDGPYVNVVDGIRWLGDAMTINDGKFLVEAHNRLPAVLAEIDRLTAELEEAQLTLAAEQGRAEGAPSEGWTCERIHRGRPTWLRRAIIQGYDGTFYVEYAPIGIDGWFWCFQSADVQTAFQPANTARAAMLAADASK